MAGRDGTLEIEQRRPEFETMSHRLLYWLPVTIPRLRLAFALHLALCTQPKFTVRAEAPIKRDKEGVVAAFFRSI